MRYEDFFLRVQQYAGLSGPDETAHAIDVTLRTLGERLPPTHRRHLAAQLPAALKPPLASRAAEEEFTLEDFYGRVAARLGTRLHLGIRLARSVVKALDASVATGEVKDVLAVLPAAYGELFQGDVTGPSAVDTHSLSGK